MMRRGTGLTALALASALTLAGCQGGPVPSPDPDPAPAVPGPVLTQERFDLILADVAETLLAADSAASVEELGVRIQGPAREMRTGEYQLAAATGGANPVTPLAIDAQVSIIAATRDWPRVTGAVTTIPAGTNLPLLLTLVQDAPRDPFALWSWVRLFPGVQMPPTTAAATGSEPVAPDTDALILSPQDALAGYVDLLNNPGGSAATSFAEDPFRAGYADTFDALTQAVAAAGTVSQESVVSDFGTRSIATHDGGAIVVGVIGQRLTVQRTIAGATLSVGTNLAYGGDPNVRGTLTARYLATVAFYVPPAGAAEPITVLGAEQVLTGVERDDSTSPD